MSKHLTLFGGLAPSLTRLILSGVHVDWNQPWITSASNLTYLDLAFHAEDVRPSWAQFAAILRGAPGLEKISLRLSGPSGEPPEWFIEPTPGSHADLNAPVQLPRVTEFSFRFPSQARAIELLHKFYLPTLKNLVVDFDNGDYSVFIYELTQPAISLSLPSTQEQPRSLLSNLETLKIAGLHFPAARHTSGRSPASSRALRRSTSRCPTFLKNPESSRPARFDLESALRRLADPITLWMS